MKIENHNLEQAVGRALKNLPELSAPRTLMPRVMAEIQRRAALPWYRRPWQMWPTALQVGSMAVLILCFGGLCLTAWQLTQIEGVTAVGRELSKLFAGVMAVINILAVLLHSAVLVVRELGTGFVIGCCFLIALGYSTCLGLGSVCVRLALAKR